MIDCFVFLYHGTSADVADVIMQHGFDERLAALQGLYGAGTYFANQSCKAAQYANDSGVKTMLVTRVTVGYEHVLALTHAGEVLSFGRGSEGQLGHGDREDRRKPMQPT